MHAIDTQDGLFHDGDGISELGTILPASWLNQIQQELINILIKANIVPDAKNNNQVTDAIMNLISSNKAAFAGIADMATKLKMPRLINGIAFDGTTDINVTPAGAVQYFAMPNPPIGWLLADGSPVPRDQYKELFAVIGTYYGAGDGRTTFNIPDLRGEFIRSWDAGRGVDPARAFGSWQVGTPISHDDEFAPEWFDVVTMGFSARNFGDVWIGDYPEAYFTEPYGYQKLAYRSNFFTMTRPRNVAFLCCIKY